MTTMTTMAAATMAAEELTQSIEMPDLATAEARMQTLLVPAGRAARVVAGHSPDCDCERCSDQGNGGVRPCIMVSVETARRWDRGIKAVRARGLRNSTPEGRALRISILRGEE